MIKSGDLHEKERLTLQLLIDGDDELRRLKFVVSEGSGYCGCGTVPCFQGKMPDDDTYVPCAIIQSFCDVSPREQMKK